jgi:hypothetical protein
LEKIEYKYKNLPLIGSICRVLILELYGGKLISRKEIIDEVTKIHLLRGGDKARAKNVERMFKSVLSKMMKDGLAERPSYGFWKIKQDNLIVPEDEIIDTAEIIEVVEEEYDADYVFGEGSGSVYIYYYPVYMQNSINDKKTKWACKIGRSERDPILRILAQASTALPETPKIAVVITSLGASNS